MYSCPHVQEPGPAKVAVTGSGIPEAEKIPDCSSIIWQEELNQREAEGAAVWATADLPPGSPLPSTGRDKQLFMRKKWHFVYGSDAVKVTTVTESYICHTLKVTLGVWAQMQARRMEMKQTGEVRHRTAQSFSHPATCSPPQAPAPA